MTVFDQTVFDHSAIALISRRPTTKRQQALLGALADLFVAEGFAHFTLDDLAARLHCSKSSLYRLAPSKDQLAVAVMQWRASLRDAELEELLAKESSVRERLITFVQFSRELQGASSQALMDDVISFKPTRDLWEQAGLKCTAQLADLVNEGIASGEFRQVSSQFMGFVVAYVSDGIRRGICARVAGLSEDDAYAELLDFVFAALAR